MLLIYNKHTKEVVHYVNNGGGLNPSLFGLYHACIKYNYKDSSVEDFKEFNLDERRKDKDGIMLKRKIFDYSIMRVVEDKSGNPIDIEFVHKNKSDPPPKTQEQKNKEELAELKDMINKQQEMIKQQQEMINKMTNSS